MRLFSTHLARQPELRSQQLTGSAGSCHAACTPSLAIFRLIRSVAAVSLSSVRVLPVCLMLVCTTAYASLSHGELEDASRIAQSQSWQQQRSLPQQRNALPQKNHPLQIQTLSIELDERKKDKATRRARVYQFNYNTQHSRVLLIDLERQTVLTEQAIASVHLPLNEQEIATAKSLIEKNTTLMQQLNAALEKRGLPQMNDLSLLDVKASVFEPANQSHPCTSQRCALISLFDQTRTVFALEPVVNLQQLSVNTLQNGQ